MSDERIKVAKKLGMQPDYLLKHDQARYGGSSRYQPKPDHIAQAGHKAIADPEMLSQARQDYYIEGYIKTQAILDDDSLAGNTLMQDYYLNGLVETLSLDTDPNEFNLIIENFLKRKMIEMIEEGNSSQLSYYHDGYANLTGLEYVKMALLNGVLNNDNASVDFYTKGLSMLGEELSISPIDFAYRFCIDQLIKEVALEDRPKQDYYLRALDQILALKASKSHGAVAATPLSEKA